MKKMKPFGRAIFFLGCICLLLSCTHTSIPHYKWVQQKGYRWSNLISRAEGHVGFKKLSSSQTNISFRNNLPKKDILVNRIYLNGSGVALGDIDGDGWTDIYFAQLDGPNKLYKNLGGMNFVDITDSAGVANKGHFSTGAAFADVDGDGDLDLIVTCIKHDNVLYLNDGKGHFSFQDDSGLDAAQGSMSIALADIDGDGDLDLYITNYKRKSVLDLFNVSDLTWNKTVRQKYKPGVKQNYTLKPPYDTQYAIIKRKGKLPERREIGRQDELFINNGDGTFAKAKDLKKRFLDADGNPEGLARDWGLTAKFYDINQDGLPDLYVCNDYWTKDRIWINQGKGIFKMMSPLAIRNMSFASMSVDFADINRDGAPDFFITEMLSPKHDRRLRQFIPDDPYAAADNDDVNIQPQYNRNSLFLNRGDNTFAETAYFGGVEATGWSWAPRFLDVDLDGYEDLLITTGYKYDVEDLDAQKTWREKLAKSEKKHSFIDTYPPLNLPNKAFKNEDGTHFTDVSSQWGFNEDDISQGLATADFDHDGDLDLAVNTLNIKASVYENEAPGSRIAVRLIGKAPNTQAIGAKIELTGAPVNQTKEIVAGGGYLSSSDPLVVFAAGKNKQTHKLKVTWPDGSRSFIDSVKSNSIYEINETDIAKKDVQHTIKSKQSIFKDVSDKINHKHHEDLYDDFRIQPLLPIKLSREGPGVSWIDYDGDGDDDLFIPSGRGGKLAIFKNDGGNFKLQTLGKMTRQTQADQTTVLGWQQNNETTLLVGNANYEPGDIKFPSTWNYTLKKNQIIERDSIPGIFSTTGPLAAADYDSDGDIDVFVGGRFVPTQYPMNATSRLFKNENGHFILDVSNSEKLRRVGLVTGAIFTDYDGDGDQDLLLSLAWGSLKLYRNEDGDFVDVTKQVGLDQYLGWWNGVATGDFNNDGRPDIIATNWGQNSPYQLNNGYPLKMYYHDFNNDGRMDIIESYYDPVIGAYVPRRQLKDYKSILNSFFGGVSDNKQFAQSSLKEILGPNFKQTAYKEINTLATTLFINQGGHFLSHPLPKEVQFSAAFYVGVADYNNDGNEDLFLSQNFFEVRPNTPRLDAGRGLWLKGNGKGTFKPVSGQESGIEVYGEQRGAALGDFNEDGKVDLAISQNGGVTKLYENKTPKSGITIRLKGSPSNADAIGSSIRLLYASGHAGPRREIQAGSGYWSQNSSKQVLGFSEIPKGIEVRWPDGQKDTVAYTPGKPSYQINYSYLHK